jgi:hypothetical protein
MLVGGARRAESQEPPHHQRRIFVSADGDWSGSFTFRLSY